MNPTTLRQLTSGTIAFTGWMLADGSVVTAKVSQKEYDALAAGGLPPGQPAPDAKFLISGGGIAALDTSDGWASIGDCWEEMDDSGNAVLVVATGPDLDWEYVLSQADDPGKGPTSTQTTLTVRSVGNRATVASYDLNALDQINVPDAKQKSQTLTSQSVIPNHKSVTFDATASASVGSTAAGSLTFAHVVGVQPNLCIGVFAACRQGQTVNSVTYNSVSLTNQITLITVPPNGTVRNTYWDLAAPATGSHNVVVTFSAATSGLAGSTSMYGVNQATPRSNTNTSMDSSASPSTNATITIASAAGELVLVHTAWERGVTNVTMTFDPSVTADWNLDNTDSNPRGAAGCHVAGAASVTVSNTMVFPSTPMAWCNIAVAIKAAATPAPGFFQFMRK